MNNQAFTKVVFLDTNVMHYARLCLEYAKQHQIQLEPDNGTVLELRSKIGELAEERLKDDLLKGLAMILLLSTDEIQVEYTPLSELEMIAGLSKGKALMTTAKEGTPFRMRSKFSEAEIRDRVTVQELADIQKTVDALCADLEAMGVPITQSNSKNTFESMTIAKEISGLIYMTEIDSLIYATALTAEADYLLTADEYLRKTVNLIRDSEEERYEQIRKALKQGVGNVLLTKSKEINLPRAFSVSSSGEWKGISAFP